MSTQSNRFEEIKNVAYAVAVAALLIFAVIAIEDVQYQIWETGIDRDNIFPLG